MTKELSNRYKAMVGDKAVDTEELFSPLSYFDGLIKRIIKNIPTGRTSISTAEVDALLKLWSGLLNTRNDRQLKSLIRVIRSQLRRLRRSTIEAAGRTQIAQG